MVDLRIDMVWTTCQNDTASTGFLHIFEDFFTLFHHFQTGHFLFFPGIGNSLAHFGFWYVKFFLEAFDQCQACLLLAAKGHERIDKTHLAGSDLVHIILDVFRIRGNDRTVVVVTGNSFLS